MNIPEAKVYFDGSNYIAIAPKPKVQGKPRVNAKSHDEKKIHIAFIGYAV